MIGALAADRPDQAFNISILPGRAERCGPVPDAHRLHPSLERDTKCPIVVTNEIFRCPIPRKRFGDLPRQLLRRRGSPQTPTAVAVRTGEREMRIVAET